MVQGSKYNDLWRGFLETIDLSRGFFLWFLPTPNSYVLLLFWIRNFIQHQENRNWFKIYIFTKGWNQQRMLSFKDKSTPLALIFVQYKSYSRLISQTLLSASKNKYLFFARLGLHSSNIFSTFLQVVLSGGVRIATLQTNILAKNS